MQLGAELEDRDRVLDTAPEVEELVAEPIQRRLREELACRV